MPYLALPIYLVILCTFSMCVVEVASTRAPTSEQARIRSMQAQAKRSQARVKQERLRQQQTKLNQARAAISTSM